MFILYKKLKLLNYVKICWEILESSTVIPRRERSIAKLAHMCREQTLYATVAFLRMALENLGLK